MSVTNHLQLASSALSHLILQDCLILGQMHATPKSWILLNLKNGTAL